MVRGANGSSFPCPSPRGVRCGLLSITCAICTRGKGRYVSMIRKELRMSMEDSNRKSDSRLLGGDQRPKGEQGI